MNNLVKIFFKKIFLRNIYLLLTTFFIKKKRIKKYKNFLLELDIRAYTQNRMYFKDYDKNITDFLMPHIKGNEDFIDIGAHIGFYSLFFSTLLNAGKVFSYEANKKNFIKLKKNILLNKFKNIECYNFGISSHNGKTRLYDTSLYNEGGHFINLEDKSVNKKFKIIKIFKLDSLLKNYNKNLFIKIDVEGHEMHVLSGMKNILKKANCFLIVETGNGKHLKNITNYLKKFNYSIKRRFGINTIFVKNF
jgi:FkbM family methyltransferase